MSVEVDSVITAAFRLPFENWMALKFSPAELADPATAGPDSDPDADLLTNWHEYLSGSDPKDSRSRGISEPRVEGGFLILQYSRLTGPADGYSITCQASRDLDSWGSVRPQQRVLASDCGIETIEARLPMAGWDSAHLRLRYSRP